MDLKNQYVFYQYLNNLINKKGNRPSCKTLGKITKKRRVPVKRDQIESLFDR